ncbi:hypothetical protein QBC33DRAFT_559309 [Phialemonium atrogriseum]|uniref:Uncharacterized protein n=1 Tax=Phialemonium atrogriseum TaxID=1093897 RepID=A0AAJ0BZJ0_9PEZI|nr:uncharacterized protein QBC33DRAFT_559309 [Phialemonium atrogriseum]KAK1767185.1 hypothetical protein QBC33DRAFT_559309 [Phialemonium atrogriseum]
MASHSPRSTVSPSKQSRPQPDHPESPIVPPQDSEPVGTNKIEPATLDTTGLDPPIQQQPLSRRAQVKTPEPQPSLDCMNGHKDNTERSPSTPGHLAPFDWDEFESRYEQALAGANNQEQELLEEFDRLVKYFNVWASAGSVHDNERGVKRLQTRERYVKIAEQSLAQKKKHLTEVVRAFQSALALLSQS